MSILFFVFDLIFLSFLPLLGIFLGSLKKPVVATNQEAPREAEKETENLDYSWALTKAEKEAIKITAPSPMFTPFSHGDILLLLLVGLLILILPIALAILHLNPLSYLTAIAATILAYSWKVNETSLNIKNIFHHFTKVAQKIDKQIIIDTLLDLKHFLQNQPYLNIVYIILTVDAIYLDLFVAKISLDKFSAAAYIFLSILSKIILVTLLFGLHKWLIEKNIFKTHSLDPRIVSMFTFGSAIIAYFFFIFSKVLVRLVSFGSLINFHTALPYIFAVHVLIMILFFLFYFNHQDFVQKVSLQRFTLHFLVSLHGAILLMLLFFSISSLEAVSFFIAGLTLFLLILFYHLFYRLHIYTQLV
jgi:hypothetical protein